MKPVEVAENVYWVGGIDWDLRDFHGYLTQRGSTYNAFLILDDQVTLVDTVKHFKVDEMLKRISQVIDPSKIDHVICNHVEMDHSGGIPAVMDRAKNAVVITSPNGEKGLKSHFSEEWKYKVVKTGDQVNTGKYHFSFECTPMVHWPDNMVTYLNEFKILFSNDAFGQHLASSERFDDEFPLNTVFEEAKKYYANIVLPYGNQVKKALDAISGFDVEIIAPSHGIIWRSNLPTIIEAYEKWSANKTENKAVIVYDTMWKSTEKIAQALETAFENAGIRVRMANLQKNHISDIMTDVITAKYICVGSPTLNNNMLPTVASFLTYFRGLAPKNRIGLAFGSYGWGGQSVKQIEDVLKDCGFEMMNPIRIQYIPIPSQLKEIENLHIIK